MPFKTRHREEDFAFILSLPDGWMGFYDKAVAHVSDNVGGLDYGSLEKHKLGDPERLIENKTNGQIAPYALAGIPKYVYDRECPLSAPIVVQIELTLRCNLTCKFCFNYSGKARANELSTDEVKSLLRQLRAIDVFSVFLTGGECTLRPDFKELVQFAQQLNIDLFVLTNGTQISEVLLGDLPKETYFVVSFDGMESHEYSHGGLDFKGLCRVFDLLRHHGFPFTAQYVLQKQNIQDLVKTYAWCEREQIDLAAIDLYPTGRAKLHPEIFPDAGDLENLIALAEAKFSYERKVHEWEMRNGRSDVPNPYAFAFIARLEEMFERSFSGVFFSYITSQGKVYGDNWHGGEGMFCAGNIREKDFMDIWVNSFRDLRKLVRWNRFECCQSCPVSKHFCDFRLPVLSRNLRKRLNDCGATDLQKALMIERSKLRTTTPGVLTNDQVRLIDIW